MIARHLLCRYGDGDGSVVDLVTSFTHPRYSPCCKMIGRVKSRAVGRPSSLGAACWREMRSTAFFHGHFVLGDDQHSGFTQYSRFSKPDNRATKQERSKPTRSKFMQSW